MKKREYKILLENWNAFLKEENKKITSGEKFIEKFILNGVSKVRKEILSRYAPHIRPHAEKTLKLMIKIEKLFGYFSMHLIRIMHLKKVLLN